MKNIFKIILVVYLFNPGLAQTSSQIKKAKDMLKKSGMSVNEAKNVAQHIADKIK